MQASTVGCDVVVFLVFNDFSTGQNTDGHKYSGFANGAPCEASQASGYTVVSYTYTCLGNHMLTTNPEFWIYQF